MQKPRVCCLLKTVDRLLCDVDSPSCLLKTVDRLLCYVVCWRLLTDSLLTCQHTTDTNTSTPYILAYNLIFTLIFSNYTSILSQTKDNYTSYNTNHHNLIRLIYSDNLISKIQASPTHTLSQTSHRELTLWIKPRWFTRRSLTASVM